MMKLFLSLIQDPSEIERKMAEAPNSAYEIGVVIGTYLPFVFLVLIAYLGYAYMKRKRRQEKKDD